MFVIKPIRQDLANHGLIGAVAACVAANLAPLIGLDRRAAALAGSAFTGVLIELVQAALNARAKRRGLPPPYTVDFKRDLAATALGGLPVALAVGAQ